MNKEVENCCHTATKITICALMGSSVKVMASIRIKGVKVRGFIFSPVLCTVLRYVFHSHTG